MRFRLTMTDIVGFTGRFRRRRKTRLKTPGPKPFDAKGRSLLDERIWRLGYVALLWLSAWLLQVMDVPFVALNGIWASTRWLGDGLLLLAGVCACLALLRMLDSLPASRKMTVLQLCAISLLGLVPAKWTLILNQLYGHLPATTLYILPLALTPLLAAILLGPVYALALGLWGSLAISLFADYSYPLLLTGVVTTAIVTRLVRNVRTRLAVLRIGLAAGFAGVCCAVGFGAISGETGFEMGRQALMSMGGGLISAVLALLLLPLLEVVFGMPTDMTLLELADREHPLLKRLAEEAPGTYHHSLMTANLAQSAANAIGCNALLAGICAYFHDVGKLVKPEYFSENIPYDANPHDELSPHMSTLVIISHVKEGVNLALRYKLPPPIVDAIQQHHGTGMVSYFYHKANAQRTPKDRDATELREDSFRYPGPRPQSKEVAILSVADAIEAASRSMEKISPSHIEGLVDEIITTKRDDGQFDMCGLTMAELQKIRRAFIFTLTNMMHGRIAYPNADENRNQQPTGAGSGESGSDSGPAPVPHGSGLPA